MQRWIFVDEEPEVARHCAILLEEPGAFEVIPVAPEPEVNFLRKALSKDAIDGVLLDHALNDAKPDIDYAGSTLAAYIRTEYAHLPIAVLSAKLKDRAELRRYRRTEELFDLQLDKQDLTLKADEARDILKALGDGYRGLNQTLNGHQLDDHQAACSLLGIPEDLEDSAERSAMARLVVEIGGGDPSRVAHFLLQVVLRLPGPLLDRDRAAVAAGLEPVANTGIDDYIGPARFTGVFAKIHKNGRYWRELLDDLDGDYDNLQRACCVVCDGVASEVCEVCKKPVDGLHSLPVRRNEVANDIFLRGRVCGFCLAGELPRELTIDGHYAKMRSALVDDAQRSQK